MDQLSIAKLGAIADPKKSSTKAEALKTASDFEAVFIADALKLMVQDVNADPLGGGADNASQSWRELLMDEYAKVMTAKGGIGLAEPMARELLSLQEAKE
jgi:peptidoglycan hydrolase FlgJ